MNWSNAAWKLSTGVPARCSSGHSSRGLPYTPRMPAGRSIYTRSYYQRWKLDEHRPYRQGRLRREDMLTSITLACLPRERVARMLDWTDLASDFNFPELENPLR